jgi:hypothetical protein
MALEETEAALGLGPFFWLSRPACWSLDLCRLFLVTSLEDVVVCPLNDLIAMGWKLSFHTVVVVRLGEFGKSKQQ